MVKKQLNSIDRKYLHVDKHCQKQSSSVQSFFLSEFLYAMLAHGNYIYILEDLNLCLVLL